MSKKYCITGAFVVNEGKISRRSVFIANSIIQSLPETEPTEEYLRENGYFHIDGSGQLLIPGVIDSHVHLREPGLTHKEDIRSGSRAAIAGGITSFMEMPNTIPRTTTHELWRDKNEIASRDSMANFAFYLGATNSNLEELRKADLSKVCGIKLFMGASTGNMIVDNEDALRKIFQLPALIAAHCEDESLILKNLEACKLQYGNEIPYAAHPVIRSSDACIRSVKKAISLAQQYNSRLHVLHISTAAEAALFSTGNINKKNITAEACLNHLWFSDADYEEKGGWIKVNPAIKSDDDRKALIRAVNDGRIDLIGSDHAPHTVDEKMQSYLQCPSGTPLVQHALPMMLELVRDKKTSYETLVQRMCHAPADCFRIKKRGYLRKGYYADLVLIDPGLPWQVSKTNTLYKCGWSALEGQIFHHSISHVFVNGQLAWVYGRSDESITGMPLEFE